ncbi:MAG: hypothetical protein AAF518_11450 [Spirochaetota bacterium]
MANYQLFDQNLFFRVYPDSTEFGEEITDSKTLSSLQAAAAGETVTATFVLRSNTEITNLSFSVIDEAHSASKEGVEITIPSELRVVSYQSLIYEEGQATTEPTILLTNEMFSDAEIRDGRISSGEATWFWWTFSIPEDARPGDYTASCNLCFDCSDEGGGISITVDCQVEVTELALQTSADVAEQERRFWMQYSPVEKDEQYGGSVTEEIEAEVAKKQLPDIKAHGFLLAPALYYDVRNVKPEEQETILYPEGSNIEDYYSQVFAEKFWQWMCELFVPAWKESWPENWQVIYYNMLQRIDHQIHEKYLKKVSLEKDLEWSDDVYLAMFADAVQKLKAIWENWPNTEGEYTFPPPPELLAEPVDEFSGLPLRSEPPEPDQKYDCPFVENTPCTVWINRFWDLFAILRENGLRATSFTKEEEGDRYIVDSEQEKGSIDNLDIYQLHSGFVNLQYLNEIKNHASTTESERQFPFAVRIYNLVRFWYSNNIGLERLAYGFFAEAVYQRLGITDFIQYKYHEGEWNGAWQVYKKTHLKLMRDLSTADSQTFRKPHLYNTEAIAPPETPCLWAGDRQELVPTIYWEWMRYGTNDMRYIVTLRHLITIARELDEVSTIAEDAHNSLEAMLAPFYNEDADESLQVNWEEQIKNPLAGGDSHDSTQAIEHLEANRTELQRMVIDLQTRLLAMDLTWIRKLGRKNRALMIDRSQYKHTLLKEKITYTDEGTKFTSDSYLKIDNHSIFNPGHAISIVASLTFQGQNLTDHKSILQKSLSYELFLKEDKLGISIGTAEEPFVLYHSTAIEINKPVSVGVMYNGRRITILVKQEGEKAVAEYKDISLEDRKKIIPNTPSPIYIGNNDSQNSGFVGTLHHLAIYSYARTEGQMLRHVADNAP